MKILIKESPRESRVDPTRDQLGTDAEPGTPYFHRYPTLLELKE